MSKLKKILKERKMTQQQVFDLGKELCKTPVPRYMINRVYKNRKTNYTVHTLIKLCRILEVTPNEILSKDDYKELFYK